MKIKNSLFVFLYIMFFVVFPASAATMSPKVVVEEASTRIFDEIKSDRVGIEADRARLYRLVDAVVLPHFDFAKMSRLVVAKKYWKKATPDMRRDFTQAFRAYLVRTYSTALVKFEIEKITYLPVKKRKNKNEVTVPTRVHLLRSKPVPIDYRLYLTKNDEWKVFDIKVDGISLIINNRNSYNKILRRSGMAGLIKVLSTKESNG